MTSEHIPGPWYTYTLDGQAGAYRKLGIAAGIPSLIIASIDVPIDAATDEYVANAALIASAPDMLAALEAVRGYLIWLGEADRALRSYSPLLRVAKTVDAAIAKARLPIVVVV